MSLFLANCGAFQPVAAGGGYDVDAQAFLTATGIVDGTISDAIDALVIALKAASVWTKLEAIYPFCGGTATTHKYNLKDPQDTDGAFRMVFAGTLTHDANGITSNGTTGYGDSKWNQSTHGAEDNEHVSVYCRTDADNTTRFFGCTNAGAGTQLRKNASNLETWSQTLSAATTAVASSLGYISINRTASAGYRARFNATNSDKTAASDQAVLNQTFYVCCRNEAGVASNFTTRNIAWFALGQGLDATEDGNVRTAVETFQDALSRGVV